MVEYYTGIDGVSVNVESEQDLVTILDILETQVMDNLGANRCLDLIARARHEIEELTGLEPLRVMNIALINRRPTASCTPQNPCERCRRILAKEVARKLGRCPVCDTELEPDGFCLGSQCRRVRK